MFARTSRRITSAIYSTAAQQYYPNNHSPVVWSARYASSGAVQARIVSDDVLMPIHFVPERQAWIVERFGKYSRTLSPGLNITTPIIENVKYKLCLSVMTTEIPGQVGITQDNVTIRMDGVLYWQVIDPRSAAYDVDDCEFAVMQLAMSTMRAELGKLGLEQIFQERQHLNERINNAINEVSHDWGVKCLRYEIRDIVPPENVMQAMELQVVSERKKREKIIISEATRQAEINEADGAKQSVVLESEAEKQRIINHNAGQAQAILLMAEATAKGIERIAVACRAPGGKEAVTLQIAEKYLDAFSKLAKDSTTMLLPAQASDPASMIAQAMSIYGKISNPNAVASDSPSHKPGQDKKAPIQEKEHP